MEEAEISTLTEAGRASWLVRGSRLSSFPLVCAVVNLTDDSFFPGSRASADPSQALLMCEQALELGADIVDLGAESTRPGSDPITETEELRRLIPVLNGLVEKVAHYRTEKPRWISVDTYKPKVAREVLEIGADIVNDISGMTFGNREGMLEVLAESDCGYVLMHTAGRPKVMQELAHYEDVVSEVENFFKLSLNLLRSHGIDPERVALDPGIGFGKKLKHNLALMRAAGRFRELGRPLLYGVSRKSWLGEVTGRPVEERLPGTIAAHAYLLLQGVEIIRVHDVAEAVDTLKVVAALSGRQA